MGYAQYLRDLLEPLGIYTFTDGSVSGGAVEAAGAALDGVSAALEEAEREALVPTAEDWGLAQLEDLFAKHPVSPTLELRRAALCALLQIGGDDFTVEAINRALSGCGSPAGASLPGAGIQTGRLSVLIAGCGLVHMPAACTLSAWSSPACHSHSRAPCPCPAWRDSAPEFCNVR